MDDDDYTTEEFGRDYTFFFQASSAVCSGSTAATLQSKVTELETEVGRLRGELERAKGVNDQMWESVVKRVLLDDQGRGSEAGGIDVEEDERRRKRSRS